jgi:ribosomal protein L17
MPFQKGISGNPKGPGLQKPFNDALRMEIAAAGDNHKALRKIANKLVEMAIDGDIRAIKEIADRLDGRPVQQTKLTSEGEPVQITFTTIYEQKPEASGGGCG